METKNNKFLTQEQQIFGEMPIPKAVATMVIPTIISQLITVAYNLADTWFVGLTENAAAVAAISLCLPVHTMLTGISNLFGVGGASVMARALGSQNPDRARKAFQTALKGALLVGLAYSLILFMTARPLLLMIGGDAASIDYAVSYATITTILAGVPTIFSSAMAHLVRATGNSKISSYGITLGAVLNLLLDPLFMFVLLPKGHEVTGAAIATALSTLISAAYFVIYLFRQSNPILSSKSGAKEPGVAGDIIKCGITSFCLTGAAMISNCFLNGMIGTMGASAAMAGIGITRKIDSVAYAVNQGITQGMLPIVSYCYASKRIDRMKKVVVFSASCTMSFSFIWALVSYFFAPELIGLFIRDLETIFYGTSFLRILCIAVAIYPLLFVIITTFQAIGDSVKPFLLSLLHKGSLDILLLFIIHANWGTEYVLWAAPAMDVIALVTAIILYQKRFALSKK